MDTCPTFLLQLLLQGFNEVQGGLAGKKVLIHAGAGGVGSFAIQYASCVG
jgi:NADPH:quinone reductase-like Zn-dependent oxidoreductase